MDALIFPKPSAWLYTTHTGRCSYRRASVTVPKGEELFTRAQVEQIAATLARNARRWQTARSLIDADTITDAAWTLEQFGGKVPEHECAATDRAIDAVINGEGK